ncbi:branched-chain alpha-keto acid dehydrogenase, E1 component, alpha subunit [Paenibacillus sp. JCM 10914]|nr:branched-chain alpha-keto acid dehydrogenase, E1 component, alpha subunit [Paenibacillus sp. JCM 10914]
MKEQEQEKVTTNNRHEQLGLTDGQVLDMYKYMVLARKFDERNLLLQRAGKINFHVSGIGQETAR